MTGLRMTLTGSLLLFQAAVEAIASLAAPMLIEGIGPPDIPLLPWETADLRRESAAASSALIVLAVVSMTAGIARLRRRDGGLNTLVAAHAGGALAVVWYGSPLLGVVMLSTAIGWAAVLHGDARQPDDSAKLSLT
ncbi:hypothetical protein [Modestobacter lapidis]|nr:hypothetical protein [Modestobacter lapidis]